MENVISRMCDLFGQNGWKNKKEKDKILFTKKISSDTNKEVEVTVFINGENFYVIYSDSKYEIAKEEYYDMLNLAEEIYGTKKQVINWSKRYKKKNFFGVIK